MPRLYTKLQISKSQLLALITEQFARTPYVPMMAEHFGCDPMTIRAYLSELGLTPRSKILSIEYSDCDLGVKIQEMLDNDMSIPQIAHHLGCSSTAVSKQIQRLGLRKRRQQLRSVEAIRHMYIDEKLSMNEIANKLGVTYQAVDYYLKKAKIEKRPIHEIQKIATDRHRKGSESHLPKTDMKSRGYCFRHDGFWFASMAELTFYITLLKSESHFRFQPFTFAHKRPDFLVEDQLVVEIKAGLKASEMSSYMEWGKQMSQQLGYKYVLLDYLNDKTLNNKYQKVSRLMKQYSLTRGKTFSINETVMKRLMALRID